MHAHARSVPGVCNAYLPEDTTLNRFMWVVNYFAQQGFLYHPGQPVQPGPDRHPEHPALALPGKLGISPKQTVSGIVAS